MLRALLGLLHRVRQLGVRLRLRRWAWRTRVRLRSCGCRADIVIGAGVRCATVPTVRIVGPAGGSFTLRVADRVDLGSTLLLDIDSSATSELTIGEATTFEHAARLQLLGGRIDLGPRCEVRDGAVLKASSPDAVLSIGEHVKIGRGAALHCHQSLVVEDLVTLAERVTVVDSFHDVDGSDEWTMLRPTGSAPVRIARNAMVLSGAVIMHGTTIGRSAVVSANALVPGGEHAAGVVLLGNPARTVRRLDAAQVTDG